MTRRSVLGYMYTSFRQHERYIAGLWLALTTSGFASSGLKSDFKSGLLPTTLTDLSPY